MNEEVQNSAAIRSAVQWLHAEIRDSLREVMRFAAQARRGGTDCLPELCLAMQKLATVVREHDRDESRILDPFLAQVDAWGTERVNRLVEDRDSELRIVSYQVVASDAEALLLTVNGLVRPLLRLLHKEERESLSPKVLRDDFIAIDQEVG